MGFIYELQPATITGLFINYKKSIFILYSGDEFPSLVFDIGTNLC
jgi:hypothetical protein